MFEKFDATARTVITCARYEAEKRNHASIGVDHLLYAIMDNAVTTAARLFKIGRIDTEAVRRMIEENWANRTVVRCDSTLEWNEQAAGVFARAEVIGQGRVSVSLLLLEIFRMESSDISALLEALDIKRSAFCQLIERCLPWLRTTRCHFCQRPGVIRVTELDGCDVKLIHLCEQHASSLHQRSGHSSLKSHNDGRLQRQAVKTIVAVLEPIVTEERRTGIRNQGAITAAWMTLLEDANDRVRKQAVTALGTSSLSTANQKVADALRRALADPCHDIRHLAEMFLRRLSKHA